LPSIDFEGWIQPLGKRRGVRDILASDRAEWRGLAAADGPSDGTWEH